MSSGRKTVMVVYGTRPEAIKMAPLVRELAASDSLEPLVVVTGQHREMLDQVNSFFGIVPDFDLDLMDHGASVNAIARRVLKSMESQIAEHRPDAVVVQGDTTSAFAASLAAFLAEVPVIHLEAGLRTHNLRSPFPEEANRQLTAVITDLHLAPTSTARANLEAEGVAPSSIVVTGNTVVDALEWAVQQPVRFTDPLLEQLGGDGASGRSLILVTTHRREAWGEKMLAAMRGLGDVARAHPDYDLLLPMHRNPIVRDAVVEALGHLPNVYLTEPLSYAEFCHVMERSYIIVTDSGGVQEEAPSLGKPVLVLRDTTERPEGVEAGTVKIVGTDRQTVTEEAERLLTDPDAYAAMANAVNPYGDGKAARRSVEAIQALLVGGKGPEEFRP
ncbi:MAG TPA: UDP-N-acetylglucosamine 2-epimerase (non-hydrolyzing) [Aeromicrobium sp.]|nr:UDP-N-acetylglucosamine 2-epimerase (non-hydrolyzing) [Aeromicrobium sp.]